MDADRFLTLNQINVCICDIKQKGPENQPIHKKIKKNFPEVIRIIVSGTRDQEILIQTSEVAHQLLAKPFDINELIAKLEKTFFLRNHLKNENIINIITGIEKPSEFTQSYT